VGDTAGIVTRMGWFDTSVRKYDESTVIIPNGKIMGVPIVNLSRMTWGQYKTEIRLRYEDMDKVEKVVETMKNELAELSPGIIRQPTRNLWVHWRDFEKDAIVLVVDVKLRCQGGSTAYYNLREKANLAIARAVKSCGAEFALPTSRKV
jgi:MscS family membrane protein